MTFFSFILRPFLWNELAKKYLKKTHDPHIACQKQQNELKRNETKYKSDARSPIDGLSNGFEESFVFIFVQKPWQFVNISESSSNRISYE